MDDYDKISRINLEKEFENLNRIFLRLLFRIKNEENRLKIFQLFIKDFKRAKEELYSLQELGHSQNKKYKKNIKINFDGEEIKEVRKK